MTLNIQEIICLIIITLSVIISVGKVMKSNDLDDAVEPIISGCSTIITFFIMVGYYEAFNNLATYSLNLVLQNGVKYNGALHICVIVLLFCIVKFLIQGLLNILHSFSVHNVFGNIKNNKLFLFIFSLVFGIIRGMVIIILICIPLVLFNSLVESNNRINVLDGLKAYDRMESLVDNKKIRLISNGLTQDVSSNSVVYYNGITLEEGVTSNREIDEKAIELTKTGDSQRKKAKDLYIWIGTNIKYDDNKAASIMEKQEKGESGAIPTFNNKTGICLDYACLYTAMAKASGLKTRIIVGEAFNGEEFISHAWNQVYLEEENKWINVDATFYTGGDYFDSKNFNEDHKEKDIAGEF